MKAIKRSVALITFLGVITLFVHPGDGQKASAMDRSYLIENMKALEAFTLIDPIGRACSDGCMETGSPSDFCTQCGQTRCWDYLGRTPIGDRGTCPVQPV